MSTKNPAPYAGGMDNFLKMEFRITSLLEAMLAVARAFPFEDETKIEVGVNLERTENGYVPAVSVEIENAARNVKDVSAEKSRVASKAVLLALAMESTDTMTLEGAKIEFYPIRGIVSAFLEVETAGERQKESLDNILSRWVFGKTYPGVY